MTGSFYSKGIRHMVPQFQKERFYAGCQPQHPYSRLAQVAVNAVLNVAMSILSQ